MKCQDLGSNSNYLDTGFNKMQGMTYVTLHGKTDTNAFAFKLQNRLLSVYIRLNGTWKRLNGLLIRLKKFASV